MGLNICFIVNSLINRSGTERVVSLLANYFTAEGYRITILNRDTEFNNVAFLLDKRVEVSALQGNIFTFTRRLQTHLSNNKYDLVLVHNMGKLAPLCAFSIYTSCPIISLEHIAFETRSRWLKLISKLAYKRIKHVVAINHNDLKAFRDIGCSNVSVIPNPLSFDNITFDQKIVEKSRRVIAVGRLTHQKNFDALINAWHLLGNQTLGWHLDIYGDGEERESLNSLIARNALKNVFIKGNTPYLDRIYKTSAFLVMSSRYEGFGMVLIEAFSFGLPVIAFNCPHGPSEIIDHGINGLLVDNQNILELSQAILQLINNEEFKNNLGQNALKSSYQYKVETIGKSWEELFKQLVR